MKKLNLCGISSNTFTFDPFSDCGITSEGMKTISSFLSQDGIVLEELDLGLKEKEEIFHHQTGRNYFRDEGCAPLVEGLKKNKSLKKLNINCISSNNTSFVDHFSDCGITAEGMKPISSVLSQDGIVLEELNLSLNEKKYFILTSSRIQQIWR